MTTNKVSVPAASANAEPTRLDELVESLRSKEGGVRQKAREALTLLGKRAVRPLIPLLRDPKSDVRWEAAKALGDIGHPGAAAELVESLEDTNGDVRWLAALGLVAIGRESLFPLLEGLIARSDSVWLRGGAHHVLHDLAKGDLKVVLTPVVMALDGIDPENGVLGPATAALEGLRS